MQISPKGFCYRRAFLPRVLHDLPAHSAVAPSAVAVAVGVVGNPPETAHDATARETSEAEAERRAPAAVDAVDVHYATAHETPEAEAELKGPACGWVVRSVVAATRFAIETRARNQMQVEEEKVAVTLEENAEEAVAEKEPRKTAFERSLRPLVLTLQPKNGFLGLHLKDQDSPMIAPCSSPEKVHRCLDNSFLPNADNCGGHCRPACPQTVTHLVLRVVLSELTQDA